MTGERPDRVRPYLRNPAIRGDLIAFVADDDIWLTSLDITPARRLTTDRAPVADPCISADGTLIAFTSRRDGAPEAHVVEATGGEARRLTYLGDATTHVTGFSEDGDVVFCSAQGEPFRSRTWAYAIDPAGGTPRRLPFGPVSAVRWGPGGAVVLGVNQTRNQGASWKRYRGGNAAALWIDAAASGEFVPFLSELTGQLEDPMWVGGRVAFLSDHEGYGNVYSVEPDGSGLTRHTDHGDFYARAAQSDGTRVVYQCAGDIWLLDELVPDSQPRRLDIALSTPRSGRAPHVLRTRRHLGGFAPSRNGQASALAVRGSVYWLTHRDGPARLLAGGGGVRARLAVSFGRAGAEQVALVTDAGGEDAIEIVPVGGTAPGSEVQRVGGGQIGRVLQVAAAPDGSRLALATHDGRVILVNIGTGELTTIDDAPAGEASELVFSPDSRWLAWSSPGADPLRQIKLARLPVLARPPAPEPSADTAPEPSAGAGNGAQSQAPTENQPPESNGDATDVTEPQVIEATPLRFEDRSPVFTLDGKYLAFLSSRTFDPVYDAQVFDMSFVSATRPYLISLAATTPSPFAPTLDGKPRGGGDNNNDQGQGKGQGNGRGPNQRKGGGGQDQVPEVKIDVEGLSERIIPVPVVPGRYRKLRVSHKGLLWLRDPPWGVLGEGRPGGWDGPRPSLIHYDIDKRKERNIVDSLDDYNPTGDGKSVVVKDDKRLRMQLSDERPSQNDQDDDNVVEIDVSRVRVQIDPGIEWAQMFDEAARLMRDHYWSADMAGVDWAAVVDRYRPLVDRIATRDDLSELFWEVQGELGTSHAYESPPSRPLEGERRVGFLGADFEADGDGSWQVARILPSEVSVAGARSPLAAPGVAISAGDVLVAIDNRPVDPLFGPASGLVGAAEKPVQLTVRPANGGELRNTVVVPLGDDRQLRYQDWVTNRRAAVHAATGGRVGYVHVPDMVGRGWAEFHRDLRLEVDREALVVDLRDNGGGHLSELVLEKLAREVRAWELGRFKQPATYPVDAPRGPLVAITNEKAGSDGDIATAGFRQRNLGPVVGTRTWGGVIGIDRRYHLVDGTSVTQPRYAFWFNELGLGVENYGAEPDIVVRIAPQDWAAGRDTQLDEAIHLVLEALESHPPAEPPDPSTRPSRAAPPLPPRTPGAPRT